MALLYQIPVDPRLLLQGDFSLEDREFFDSRGESRSATASPSFCSFLCHCKLVVSSFSLVTARSYFRLRSSLAFLLRQESVTASLVCSFGEAVSETPRRFAARNDPHFVIASSSFRLRSNLRDSSPLHGSECSVFNVKSPGRQDSFSVLSHGGHRESHSSGWRRSAAGACWLRLSKPPSWVSPGRVGVHRAPCTAR